MPTKRNRAGQQQNYVPQGNGDASGEYADQASGSNKHFTNFKKPDENENSENKTFANFSKGSEKSADIETQKQNFKKSISERFQNVQQADHLEETVDKLSETLNDEAREKLNQYLAENKDLQFAFGGAGRNAAGRATNYTKINTNSNPHTIRHEIGHTYDNFYGKDLPSNGEHKTFLSSDYASVKFVDPETGKTMNEMLHEELNIHNVEVHFVGWRMSARKTGRDSFQNKKASMKKIADIYNKYCDKIFDKVTGIENARNRYVELVHKKNDSLAQADKLAENTPEGLKYAELRQQYLDKQEEYREQQRAAGRSYIYWGETPELAEIKKKRDEAYIKREIESGKIYRLLFTKEDEDLFKDLTDKQSEVNQKMRDIAGIVGDTADYMNVGSGTFWSTAGHGNNYFKERYDSGYALEIFANMFAAYASNSKEAVECIKEMFPKSVKTFEKIYNRQFK